MRFASRQEVSGTQGQAGSLPPCVTEGYRNEGWEGNQCVEPQKRRGALFDRPIQSGVPPETAPGRTDESGPTESAPEWRPTARP